MRVFKTPEFNKWLEELKDRRGRIILLTRLLRLEEGNVGNSRNLGGGLHELKIDFGPGYRVYFVQRGNTYVLLLCGGDKSTQNKDIQRAKELAARPFEEAENDPESDTI